MRTTDGFCYRRTLSDEVEDELYLPLDFRRCALKMVYFESKATCRRCHGKNIICRRVERFVHNVAQAEIVFDLLFKIHAEPIIVRLRPFAGGNATQWMSPGFTGSPTSPTDQLSPTPG